MDVGGTSMESDEWDGELWPKCELRREQVQTLEETDKTVLSRTV
jgi:hypothetical protein